MASPVLHKMWWAAWLWMYIGYALLLVGLFAGLGQQAFSIRTPLGVEEITDLTKLVVNSLFLTAVVSWSKSYHGMTTRRHLDQMLHIVFLLTLLQLLVYFSRAGFSHVGTAENSSVASELYDPSLFFWGVTEKNILGAKIALFGFLYLVNHFLWRRKFSVWRSLLVLLCALLSNSRTPILALFVGIVYLLFRLFSTRGRLMLSMVVMALVPIIAVRLLRVENLLDRSDGMGIRFIYWSTFFSHLSAISIFGRGFMSTRIFLGQYSPVFLGEPQIHNLFLNNYLDFGIPGSVFYAFFLFCFYKSCKRDFPTWFPWFWTAAFLPLLVIMVTLSAGYDSDTAVYLSVIFIIGRNASGARDSIEQDSGMIARYK